jgi:serine/threonine protein kinase/Tfp pilus assembly protein PilF
VDADSHSEPAQQALDPTRSMQAGEGTLGVMLGPYKLLRQLGEGGMGVVYHAQQLEPIRRDVALKVIKPGMDSKQVIARFEGERQALAVMDHPNIARVFDAGTTPNGLPYFVMELVDGFPVTRYCDTKHLSIRERIELFIPICRAIQHAHQKGIIHRDIKPSNLLVRQQEGKAVPKVIDFGLSKALGFEASSATMMTNLATVVGTFSYMSPEQAEWGRHDIDTRTDVYSLGAVLYQLLTGTTPLEGLQEASYVEVLRRIREEDTDSPSTRVRRSAELKKIADLRRTDPAKLPKLLDRELDWIIMKTLEKDRVRRYETVNGLARDLERYLEGEPVEAAPPSAAYRVSKFILKYRVWLATAVAFAAVLLAGFVISAWMAVRARRAEAESQAVIDFLQNDLLSQASAYNQAANAKADPNLTVRTALDRAASRVDGKFANQPLLEASIRQRIANVYLDLGLYPEAESQYERALAIRRRELGDKNLATFSTMASLAAAYERSGNLTKAEPLYREVFEKERRVLGEQHPSTLETMNGLAVTYLYEGDYAQSAALLEKLVPMDEHVFGDRDLQTLRAMGNLGAGYIALRKDSLAEPILLKTLELKRKWLGSENPETLDTMTNLAEFYRGRGEYDKAESLYATALAGYRRVLGVNHPSTINSMNSLGELFIDTGKYPQAEALFKEAFDSARIAGREKHPFALASLFGVAEAYEREGHFAQAESLYTKVLEGRRDVLGNEHPDTLDTLVSLGNLRIDQQHYTRGEAPLREALAVYEKTMPDSWERYDCEALLGVSLTGQKRFADAEPLLIAGYEGMLKQKDTASASERADLPKRADSILNLYHDWGKAEKIAEWQQKLQHAKGPAPPNRS